MCGALHGLVPSEDSSLAQVYPPNRSTDERLWQTVEAAMRRHAPAILARLGHPPQ
jgi:hypothetical protein